jgi:hypothetical protein
VANELNLLVDHSNNRTEGRVEFIISVGDQFYPRGADSADDPRFQTYFEKIYNYELPESYTSQFPPDLSGNSKPAPGSKCVDLFINA